jgi:hypothetical protein
MRDAPPDQAIGSDEYNREKDVEFTRFDSPDRSDAASDDTETQAGVKRIEAISKSWTKTSLIIAYVTYVNCISSTPSSDEETLTA